MLLRRSSATLDMVRVFVEACHDSLLTVEAASGDAPLHVAIACSQKIDVVKCLVENGPIAARFLNVNGWLLLHYCKSRTSPDVVKLLLEVFPEGTLVAQEREKRLPIHCLCENGAPAESIRLLLSTFPGQINAVTSSSGRNLLHFACRDSAIIDDRREEIIEMLLELKPDLAQSADHDGLLPLHVAASSDVGNRGKVVELLLESYPNAVHQPDTVNGSLPLHHALTHWWANLSSDLVELLVRASLRSVRIPNNQGWLP